MPAQSKGSSVTRTLRLNKDLDSVIQNEAERLGMSSNALINKVLLQFKDVLRFDDPGNWITMSRETFSSIFSKISFDEIEDIADEYGSLRIQEHLLRRGMALNEENVFWYISQVLGEYSGWFRCNLYEKKNDVSLHLSHNFGRNWSYFLVNYISNIIRTELGLKVESVILENDVHLTITK